MQKIVLLHLILRCLNIFIININNDYAGFNCVFMSHKAA